MRKVRYLLCTRIVLSAAFLACFFAGCAALAIALPSLLLPAAAIERVLSLFAAVFIFGSPAPFEHKARRLFLLLLLPWLGLLLLPFLARAPKPLPLPQEARMPQDMKDGTMDDKLFAQVSTLSFRFCGLGGCGAQAVRYFPTGREMGERLLSDLKAAETEILLEFFLIARGKFFDELLRVLEQKAAAGVKVKLIYDDFGCAGSLSRKFPKELSSRGIETTVFHPLRAFPLKRLNRRDHRKIAVIDRKIAYTGGVNLSDEYIGERILFGHWKDTAVRLEGAPAKLFAALVTGERPEKTLSLDGSPCVVFADDTQSDARLGEEIFFRMFSAARSSIRIFTPYLAPSEKLRRALLSAAASGVKVQIMIPHIPDKKAVFALTRAHARELANGGVEVKEYTAGFLHAKSVTADGKYAFVGSYNLDGRSLALQAECGVFVSDGTLCADMDRDFAACFQAGSEVPKQTVFERLLAFFMRLFGPLV